MSSIESDRSLAMQAMQTVDATSKLCPEIVLSCDTLMFVKLADLCQALNLNARCTVFCICKLAISHDQLMKHRLWSP